MRAETPRNNLNAEFARVDTERIKSLQVMFTSTLTALAKSGQVDRGLLAYAAKAVETAFSLFPFEEIAFQIVLDAALNVKRVANEKEHHRRYYRSGKKTKVLSSRTQLFQQMIWCESQKW